MTDPRKIFSFIQKKDDRQQAQIKQLNEQQRREQENIYIEELAELISDSFTDMSVFSVKADKCAILQETVNQIQQIHKQAESGSGDEVQQSQVSSSKPSILANDLLGPLLLEALDGFLFVVNSQGKVEFVSENITQYLSYSQDDLVGKSVYNIIHVGDHAQFSNTLVPMSVENSIAWPGESNSSKGCNFNCRMLIKPPREESDVEVKQSYVSQYESMQITAILQPYLGEKFSETRGESENQTCLVCIARRLPLTEKANMMIGIEQFTTRQDLNDNIIHNDTRGLVANYGHIDFKGRCILEFCHANDVTLLRRHFQEVKKLRSHTSSVYRFKVQENRYVFVQTKSQLFSRSTSNDSDCIVSTHSIIRECDSEMELKGSASTSLMKSIIGQSNVNNRATTGGGGSNSKNLTNRISATVGLNLLGEINALTSPQLNMEGLDLLNSNTNWDMLTGDSTFPADLNVIAALGSNANVNTTVSNWDNVTSQMKMGQPSLPTQSQSGGVPMTMAKRQTAFQQHRSQSLSFDDRKSPRFSPSPSGRGAPYPLQAQRSIPVMGSYSSQQSPGSGSVSVVPPSRSPSAQFTAPFPQQKKAMRSPQPGVSSTLTSWPRFPTSSSGELPSVSSSLAQLNPINALQSMDSQGSGSDLIDPSFRLSGSSENLFSGSDFSSDIRSNPRAGKLCQLLTGKTSFDQMTSSASETSKAFLERSLTKSKSTTDITRQSPQPGPGQSPPEKPQSTSNDDVELSLLHREGVTEKKDNAILKKLLSQEEEDMPTMDTEISSSPHTGNANDKSGIEMDKNEAEAKKPPNVLLKQLLSEDKHGEALKCLSSQLSRELSTPVEEIALESNSKRPPPELLKSLLQEEEQNSQSCTSAPAESTIQDQDVESGSRSRHQSGQQEPQSSVVSQPVTPQSVSGLLDTSQFDLLMFPEAGKRPPEAGALMQNKNLDSLLTRLWEKGDNASDKEEVRSRQKKRKSSSSDVDSTEVLESDISASTGQQSRLSQNNALLAQLLSKKAAKETVVNTKLTVNPTAMPQQRIPKNITDKLIQVRTNSIDQGKHPSDGSDVDKESSLTPNPRDNPRTNPNAPFPGNTKPTSGSESAQMNTGLSLPPNNDEESATGFNQFQQFLSMSQGNDSMSMEIDSTGGDSSDPLLQQILQQAAELQNELTGSSIHQATAPAPVVPQTSQSHAGVPLSLSSLSTPAQGAGPVNPVSNAEDMNVIQEMEQLMDSWDEIDTILGINSQNSNMQIGPSSVTEQIAIEAIQRQLMSEEPVQPGPNPSVPSANHIQNTGLPQVSASQASGLQQMPSRQTIAQLQMAQRLRQQQQQALSQVSGIDAAFQQQLQQQQQQQMQPPPPSVGALGQSLPGQIGPRFPQPQAPMGPLVSALQAQPPNAQRPVLRGMNPTSSAIQVRQTLLQQQKVKLLEKQRMKQAQERQRLLQQQRLMLLQQQQQQQKFGFQQGNVGVDGHFPENLGELMNSGHAPNVTLPVQRGQAMPGPMSPRYNPGAMNAGNQAVSPMIPPSTPPSQLSPHFNQQQQYNLQPGNVQAVSGLGQGSQFPSLQRHRSLSGNVSSPGGQPSPRFQFPENQFPQNQQNSQLGMFPGGGPQGQQQQQQQQGVPQQMFAQNRLMQRQISLPPGRGSPRTPHSPYGNSPDPMLMSPHSISPNSRQSQQPGTQLSPGTGFNHQPQMSVGFTSQPMSAPSNFTGPSLMSTATTSFNQSLPSSSQGIPSHQSFQQPFDLQFLESGSDSKKPGLAGDLNPSASNSTSQYVKQELRIICSARSEKQHQSQQQQQQQQQLQQQQQQQLQQQQQDQLSFDTGGELPFEILETINNMAKEHGSGLGGMEELAGEEDVLSHSRQEAKKRYEQFQVLSTGQGQYVPEDPETKASTLFRTQLRTVSSTNQQNQNQNAVKQEPIPQVNVVQREPRTPIDDIKPTDHKNSLLQQLLSE